MTSQQPINDEHATSEGESTNEENLTISELLAPFRKTYDGIHANYRDSVWPVYAGLIYQPDRTAEESISEFKSIRDDLIDDLCLRVIEAVREVGYAHVDELGIENVQQVLFRETGYEERNRQMDVEMLTDAEAYLVEKQKVVETAKTRGGNVVERSQLNCTNAAKACQMSRTSNSSKGNTLRESTDFRTYSEEWSSLLSDAEVARIQHVRFELAEEVAAEFGLVPDGGDAHRALRHEWVRRAKEDRKNRVREADDEEAVVEE